jgi:hypothetical protein
MGDIEMLVHLPNAAMFESTTDKRQRFGQIAISKDGRTFRYGLSGAAAIATARLTQTPVPDANLDELVVPTARSIGDRTVTLTLGATNPNDNDFVDGYLNVEDDTGEGYLYNVDGNTDDATTLTISLEGGHGLQVAWTTSTTAGIWKNPWRDIIIHPSPPTAMLTGVTTRAQAAARYGWYQMNGLASILVEGTTVIARTAAPSLTADGAVAPWALVEAAPPTGFDALVIGATHEVAATTEEGTFFLNQLGI